MKINAPTSTPAGLATTAPLVVKGADTAAEVKQADSTGNTDRTPSGPQVSITMSAAYDGVFDEKKVAEIRAAIEAGEFKVNPEKIADGLIDHVQGILGQKKQK